MLLTGPYSEKSHSMKRDQLLKLGIYKAKITKSRIQFVPLMRSITSTERRYLAYEYSIHISSDIKFCEWEKRNEQEYMVERK